MNSLDLIAGILESRRKALGLTQKDMLMRIGMTQQQYQRLEAGGDMRVSTLLRVLEGMGLELMLVPREQAGTVKEMLVGDHADSAAQTPASVWDSELRDLDD